MTLLERAIEYTCEQLSWSNKGCWGKVYLLLGYATCIVLIFVLIIILYHETHKSGVQTLSSSLINKIKSGPKERKILDHTNVTKMIYILEHDPAKIESLRMKNSSSRLTYSNLWTLPNVGGSVFNQVEYQDK